MKAQSSWWPAEKLWPFSVPDGDGLVQAAENPATKQRSHLLLPLSGLLILHLEPPLIRRPPIISFYKFAPE